MADEPGIQTRLLHHLGDACMTISQIAEDLGFARLQVHEATRGLIEKGYIDRRDVGCFELTTKGRNAAEAGITITSGPNGPLKTVRAPRVKSLRQRAWNAMRIQREFSVIDLVTVAGKSGASDRDIDNLRRYFRSLVAGKYLRKLSRRQIPSAPGSKGYAVFALIRNTGPVAPVYSETYKRIRDFNTGEDAPCNVRR